MKIRNLFCFFLVSSTFFGYTAAGFAAEFYIVPELVEVERQEEFKLDIKLDLDQDINTFDLAVRFDADKLFAVDVLEGESVVPIWLERQIEDRGEVQLSGLFPGGYSGLIDPDNLRREDGLIASIIFKARSTGATVVSIDDIDLLANDGQATPVLATARGADVLILDSENPKKFEIMDEIPPQILETHVYKDPESGSYLLAFYGEDKQSGVDYYEVRVGEGGVWQSAQNPHMLGRRAPDDLWVKVVDKAGNIDIVKVDTGHLASPSVVILAVLLCLAGVAVFCLIRFI